MCRSKRIWTSKLRGKSIVTQFWTHIGQWLGFWTSSCMSQWESYADHPGWQSIASDINPQLHVTSTHRNCTYCTYSYPLTWQMAQFFYTGHWWRQERYPVAAWHSGGSMLVSINEVTLHRAQLVRDGWQSVGGYITSVCDQPLRPTQPSTLSGAENEYRPKCGDTLHLGSKDRYGSFHLWINMWVAGKIVWSLVNTCHTWVP